MTKLAAENPNPTFGSMDAHVEIGRRAFISAASLAGVPDELATAVADQLVVEFQKAVAPHVKAPKFELHDLG